MNSVFLFLPLILFFERDIIREHWQSFYSLVFWGVMNAAGIFGFLIGIITIAQISLTSPLTHNISGTAKACVQTLVAVIFLGDKMSMRSVMGTACVLFGTFMYSVVRSKEMDKNKLKSSPKINTLLNPIKENIDLENNDESTEERPLLVKRDQY